MNCDISKKLNYFPVLILPGRGVTLNMNVIAPAFLLRFDNAFAIMSEDHSIISFINIC